MKNGRKFRRNSILAMAFLFCINQTGRMRRLFFCCGKVRKSEARCWEMFIGNSSNVQCAMFIGIMLNTQSILIAIRRHASPSTASQSTFEKAQIDSITISINYLRELFIFHWQCVLSKGQIHLRQSDRGARESGRERARRGEIDRVLSGMVTYGFTSMNSVMNSDNRLFMLNQCKENL